MILGEGQIFPGCKRTLKKKKLLTVYRRFKIKMVRKKNGVFPDFPGDFFGVIFWRLFFFSDGCLRLVQMRTERDL